MSASSPSPSTAPQQPQLQPRMQIKPRPQVAPIAPSPIAPSPTASGSSKTPPSATGTSTNENPVKIVTSKTWVLPPRPKPGRKPASDTPATKRKAQNRAAQRAFRERRANRVAELEEKLADVEKERDDREMQLQQTLTHVTSENAFLRESLLEMRREIDLLKQSTLGSTPAAPQRPAAPRSSPAAAAGTPVAQPDSFVLQQASPAPSSAASPRTGSGNAAAASADACGICVKDDCLCEEIGIKPVSVEPSVPSVPSVPIASFAPMEAVPLPRKRKLSSEAMEIDFTAKFARSSGNGNGNGNGNGSGNGERKKLPPALQPRGRTGLAGYARHGSLSMLAEEAIAGSPKLAVPEAADGGVSGDTAEEPVDSCGFCSDDTPCVCREAAKAKGEQPPRRPSSVASLPPILGPFGVQPSRQQSFERATKLPVFHPGPTKEVSPASASASVSASTSGCTGNPGTCAQCQKDPMSTLFCATLASRLEHETEEPAKSSETTQTQTQTQTQTSRRNSELLTTSTTPITDAVPTSGSGVFIPCADAYKTLSRHAKFSAVDLGTIVQKLNTRGMEVEVQSVANVLRELDRRLYN